MTNQPQPLTLQLSNGQEVSVQAGKSILQFTENDQQHNCAIVRGPEGVAVYNANGDVQINGVPSSTHWLQAGDQLQFGSTMTASVQQLGQVEKAIDSLVSKQDQPSAEATPVIVPITAEESTFSPATAATEYVAEPQVATPTVTPVKPATLDVAVTTEFETPITSQPADAAQPEISSFAADLLARIKADENEPVGTPPSEITHSPLATDGLSFSSSTTDDSMSIASPSPTLPPTSDVAAGPEAQPPVGPASTEPSQVETTTAESSERQAHSSSVAALLDRMKTEGQWEGIPAESETEVQSEAEVQAAPTSPDPVPESVVDETADDVQSYMSQLLSRMRNPNEAQPAVTASATQPVQVQAVEEPVESPKPAKTKLLKPEEYIPKSKAKRLDSLQEMRALANTQTRTAIDRSQAKRKEAYSDYFYLAIAITSCVVTALVFLLDVFGEMTFAVGMVSMVTGAFFCCKTYFSELLASKKDSELEAPQEPNQIQG